LERGRGARFDPKPEEEQAMIIAFAISFIGAALIGTTLAHG
jgi:hypothetical protein